MRQGVLHCGSIHLFSLCVLCALCGKCFSASPSIGDPRPRGGQRGTEQVIVIPGGNLADAQEVVFYSRGFTVTKLEVVNPSQLKATVKIAADCRLGEHSLRVRCASGLSNMHTYWVGALPAVEEKEPNN